MKGVSVGGRFVRWALQNSGDTDSDVIFWTFRCISERRGTDGPSCRCAVPYFLWRLTLRGFDPIPILCI